MSCGLQGFFSINLVAITPLLQMGKPRPGKKPPHEHQSKGSSSAYTTVQVDFKAKKIAKDKKEHYITVKDQFAEKT